MIVYFFKILFKYLYNLQYSVMAKFQFCMSIYLWELQPNKVTTTEKYISIGKVISPDSTFMRVYPFTGLDYRTDGFYTYCDWLH